MTSEDKTTLTDMLNRFKQCNPRWDDVSTVIKDMTERAVFKNAFPQIQLQICLFHTLRTFSREVSIEKLGITSAERKSFLALLEKLAYAQTEDDYLEKYSQFCNDASEKVVTYFNTIGT